MILSTYLQQSFLIIVISILFVPQVYPQAPNLMSYQAVIRDTEDNLIQSSPVGIRFSIIKDSPNGNPSYTETHTATTNVNGLVSLDIGSGTVVLGSFNSIEWEDGSYYVYTEIDPSGGSDYTISGVTQLLSVPFALHSKSSDEFTGTLSETDPEVAANFDFTNASSGDLLEFDGTQWVKKTPDYISDYTVTEQDVVGQQESLSITESQITDLSAYITSETDPEVAANFDFTNASSGDLLEFDGTQWVKKTPDYITDYTVTEQDVVGQQESLSITESQISDLSAYITSETDPEVAANFDFTNASSGDLLEFDGTQWVKKTPDYISDYTVTEQDVVAQQESISITESQISDFGNYTEDGSTGGSSTSYTVGDFVHGGVVFWVDETGQHGLVAAKEDQNPSGGVRWFAGSSGDTQAKGDGLLAGKANTTIIIAALVAIGDDGSAYAARICNELVVEEGSNKYGDWYLPSLEELKLIYANRVAINSTATSNGGTDLDTSSDASYWSSTEITDTNALYIRFDNSEANDANKGEDYLIRAIRKF